MQSGPGKGHPGRKDFPTPRGENSDIPSPVEAPEDLGRPADPEYGSEFSNLNIGHPQPS